MSNKCSHETNFVEGCFRELVVEVSRLFNYSALLIFYGVLRFKKNKMDTNNKITIKNAQKYKNFCRNLKI